MIVADLIAQHVIEVHEGNNWTEVSLAATLHDVTLAEATTHTAASPNTIAAILHHLTFWNRVMVRRSQGIATDVGEANGFDVPTIHTEADWHALQADNRASAYELAAAIRAVREDHLSEPIMPGYSSAYKNLQGSVEHIHYHLGQVVILKNLVRHSPTL
ncbi:DinB family protein [Hymenobacter sp. HMF4947]|uniref:DinB family protein n=1 Tax=Hymenobacter ginkgonis TaxID=2682976 RepID=A0A7K1TA62_9BACT|nr:DinB family protein [Hymenobacter ginkgonis]MVN75280.1 DinB family protein [Hymenobacter ginkgonis]